ncbi:glycosyltransferase family 4 protein [Haloarcula laminariae]|uniref:glycosyltransferase family 4 protein n=1 Tax=Haloarcula laminariae TaxID=2961577 RepID=UPI0021C98C53|nr:glycosyltransferase family 4 protein [Halomicroarcula laminariae]
MTAPANGQAAASGHSVHAPSDADVTLPPRSHVCFISPYIRAYLEPGAETHVGGAQRQQYLLATRLRERGHTVSFVSFESEGDTRERIDGFDVWNTLPATNDAVAAPKALAKILRTIRRVDADLFYVRGNPPLCILASYCCALLDESLVYVVANDSNVELSKLSTHHGLFEYTLPKLAYVDAIGRADRVVAQTDHQRDILADVFDIQSTVVPNGYTVPPDDEVVPASERGHVLWVGTLDPDQKRPERFLDLAERLPGVDFRMVGWSEDAAYRSGIVDRADALPNLAFEGFVPPDEIDRHYRDAVAYVNTSAYEGFPNTVLESWRFAVPVVSLRAVLDGLLADAGVGYRTGTMDELTETVDRLWNDRDEAAATGRAGREYLQDNYALDAVYETYAGIFTDIISGP